MSKLTEWAREALGDSRIMSGREKLKTEEVISRFPNGAFINDCELINTTNDATGEVKPYAVVTFVDEPGRYYACGEALTKMLINLSDDHFDSDFDALALALVSDPLGVKLSLTRTRKGNNFTAVTVL